MWDWLLLILLMLPAILYEVSPRGRFYIRMALVFITPTIIAALVIPLGVLKPGSASNSLLFVRPLRIISGMLGLQWRLRGDARLKQDTACVVVSNHQSAIDVLGMVEVWPRLGKVASIIKREVWLNPIFALACWLCGQFFINRSSRASSLKTISDAEKRMVDEKLAVWLYPEGTRNRKLSGLLPFKKGAFHMAISAQVPVYPIVFSSYRHFLDPECYKFTPGRPIVSVLEPVPTAGLSSENVDELVDRVYKIMNDEFNKISAEDPTVFSEDDWNEGAGKPSSDARQSGSMKAAEDGGVDKKNA